MCHGVRGKGSFQAPPIDQSGTAAVDFMVRTGRMPIPFGRFDSGSLAQGEPPAASQRREPKYDEAQIDALVEYTSGFVSGPEAPESPDLTGADLSRGGELYRLNCAACHQMAGRGGALAYGTVAPPLWPATPLEVVEAVRTGPGTMPDFSHDVLDDEELRDVTAYVAYLDDPRDRGGLALWHLGPVPEGLLAWVVGIGGALVLIRWLGQRTTADRRPQ